MKKRIIQSTLLTTIILLCSSCGIYSSYTQQDTGIAIDSLYRDVSSDEDIISLGTMNWKDLFTDQALQQLIERGLENNTDLKSAFLRIDQAEAALSVARLSFLPSFNFAADGTISHYNSVTTRTYTLPVVASWEIDLFDRIRNAKRRTQAVYEQSLEYRQAVRTRLIASIANIYYTLLMLDSQLAVSEATTRSWKENVSTMEALMNAGMANEAARSKADWRNNQIASLKNAVESTELLMSHGSSTYLEVLTAQQALLSSQLTHIADRFEEIQGVVNLYHALGGGKEK